LKIIEALRIEKGSIVAIVGAGGKTSLMFTLANDLPKPVCLTTTTKLAYGEVPGSFNHLLFSEFENQACHVFEKAAITFISNPIDDRNQKWLGISLSQADDLITICKQQNVTYLIEADGARHLSLKAPAEWEPVIPQDADWVIVVVGLSIIGKPLNSETVFRPELFSNLTGLPPGAQIQLEHVISMLNHPAGGLKSTPPGSKVAVVFNQADAYSLKPEELDLVRKGLQKRFSAAILTSLRIEPEMCEVIFTRN
jgi:probable selenium-dependent hydroxylase accessory protein YqeC